MNREEREALSQGEIDPDIHKEVRQQFNIAFSKMKAPKGLAILYGNTDPPGVMADVDNMERTFSKLGFVVLSTFDQGKSWIQAAAKIAACQYPYPESCRFIVFYYSGHGGSDDTHAFIYPTKRNKRNKLFIEEGILQYFYPENAQGLGNRVRLFFFDSCLLDDTQKGPDAHSRLDQDMDLVLPPRGNMLVAYATSSTYSSRGNDKNGGIWTQHLHRNITEFERLPITTILDITWTQTMKSSNEEGRARRKKIQGPHYVSCLGLTYLHHPEYTPEDALKLCFEQSLSQGKKEKGVREKAAAMLKRTYFTRTSSRGLMETHGIEGDDDPVEEGDCMADRGLTEETDLTEDREEEKSLTSPSTPVPEDPKINPLLGKDAKKDDIRKILMGIAIHWPAIARAFKVDDTTIKKMEVERSAPGDKVKAIVSQWSEAGNKTTWGELVSMLRSIEGAPDKIFQKLAEDKFYNKYK